MFNSYTYIKSFAFDIFDKSVLPKDDTKNNADKTNNNDNEKKQ